MITEEGKKQNSMTTKIKFPYTIAGRTFYSVDDLQRCHHNSSDEEREEMSVHFKEVGINLNVLVKNPAIYLDSPTLKMTYNDLLEENRRLKEELRVMRSALEFAKRWLPADIVKTVPDMFKQIDEALSSTSPNSAHSFTEGSDL